MTEADRQTVTKKKLTQVHPVLARKVLAIISDLEGHNWQPYVAQGWRTQEDQDKIVAAGNSLVHFSFHMARRAGQPCALACDIVDSRYNWDIPQDHPFWHMLGSSAHAHGCYWGGDWVHFHDVAHVQLLPNSDLRAVAHGYSPPDTMG